MSSTLSSSTSPALDRYTWERIGDPNIEFITDLTIAYDPVNYIKVVRQMRNDLDPQRHVSLYAACRWIYHVAIELPNQRPNPNTPDAFELKLFKNFTNKMVKYNYDRWNLEEGNNQASDALLSLLFYRALCRYNDEIGALLLKLSGKLVPYKVIKKEYPSYIKNFPIINDGFIFNPRKGITDHPLNKACYNGFGQTVSALIKKGCDLDAPDKDKDTPIACVATPCYGSWSLMRSRFEIIRELLLRGANPNKRIANNTLPPIFIGGELPEKEKIDLLRSCIKPLEVNDRIINDRGESISYLEDALKKEHYAFAVELIARGAVYSFKKNKPSRLSNLLPHSFTKSYIDPTSCPSLLFHLALNSKCRLATFEKMVNKLNSSLSSTDFPNPICASLLATKELIGEGSEDRLFYLFSLVYKKFGDKRNYHDNMKVLFDLYECNTANKDLFHRLLARLIHTFPHILSRGKLLEKILENTSSHPVLVACCLKHAKTCPQKQINELLQAYCSKPDTNKNLHDMMTLHLNEVSLSEKMIWMLKRIGKGNKADLDYFSQEYIAKYMPKLTPFFEKGTIADIQSALFYYLVKKNTPIKNLYKIEDRIPRFIPLEILKKEFPHTFLSKPYFLDVLFNAIEYKADKLIEKLSLHGVVFDLNQPNAFSFLQSEIMLPAYKASPEEWVRATLNSSVSTLTREKALILIDALIASGDDQSLAVFLKENSRFRKRRLFVEKILGTDLPLAKKILSHLQDDEAIRLMKLWHHRGFMLHAYAPFKSLFTDFCEKRKIQHNPQRLRISPNLEHYILTTSWLLKSKCTDHYQTLSEEEYGQRVDALTQEVITLWESLKWKSNPTDDGLEEILREVSWCKYTDELKKNEIIQQVYSSEDIGHGLKEFLLEMKGTFAVLGTHKMTQKTERREEYTYVLQDFEVLIRRLKQLNDPATTAGCLINIFKNKVNGDCFIRIREEVMQQRRLVEEKPQGYSDLIDYALNNALFALIDRIIPNGQVHHLTQYHYAVGLTGIKDPICQLSPDFCFRTAYDKWDLAQFLDDLERFLPTDVALNWLISTPPPWYGYSLLLTESWLSFKEQQAARKMKRAVKNLQVKPVQKQQIIDYIKQARGKTLQFEYLGPVQGLNSLLWSLMIQFADDNKITLTSPLAEKAAENAPCEESDLKDFRAMITRSISALKDQYKEPGDLLIRLERTRKMEASLQRFNNKVAVTQAMDRWMASKNMDKKLAYAIWQIQVSYEENISELAREATRMHPNLAFNFAINGLPSVACSELRSLDYLKDISSNPKLLYLCVLLRKGVIAPLK